MRRAVLLVAGLALTTACGSPVESVSADGDTRSASPSASATATPDSGTGKPKPAGEAARSVTITTGGGIAGEMDTRQIDAGHPLADKVLPLTADRSAFAGLSESATPPCCDLIAYDVTIDYAEGADVRFLTWDGADVPHDVDKLVKAATRPYRMGR